jgi:hypothetical protein
MVEMYFLFVSFGVRIVSPVEILDLAGGGGPVSCALEVSVLGTVGGWYGGGAAVAHDASPVGMMLVMTVDNLRCLRSHCECRLHA